jgi:hypothetical protein
MLNKRFWLKEYHRPLVATCQFYCIVQCLLKPADRKHYVFNHSRAWRLQKHYVFHHSRAWRLQNSTFSIMPAPGGSKSQNIAFSIVPAPDGSKSITLSIIPVPGGSRTNTFSIIPASGGSETLRFFHNYRA